ncbi:MAG: sugar phosphate isomerase/epimerase [Chloroflexi bacterium]|nr:sugar phosphate isomerase/epimerase [Chloroflexota bacterium]
MRYGIMTMQLSALIPSGVTSPQAAMAQIAQFDLSSLVRQLVSHGFKTIELGGDLAMFMPHTFAPSSIEKLAALKKDLAITYTVHLPLWSVEPSTPEMHVRQGSVRALVDIIRATQPLEPEDYVLHAYGALASEFYRMNIPESARMLILQIFQANARDSIKTILAETGIPSRKLAVETIEFPLDMMLALANELDTSICFDTGHVLAGFPGPIDFFDALEKCLPRIAQFHLHDCPSLARTGQIGYGKDHQALGKGDLDLARFLNRLKQVNFSGPLVYELTVPEALASIQVVNAIK